MNDARFAIDPTISSVIAEPSGVGVATARGPHPARFHVQGFNEQGTTTTPFDVVVLNHMSRYHLAALAIKHAEIGDWRWTDD